MQNLRIQGPAGQLELRIDQPDNVAADAPVAVLCHPHPLHGGSLNNKVVHILASSMNRLGAVAVRFNFRGVGRSEGAFDNAVGEQDDLRADVLRQREGGFAIPGGGHLMAFFAEQGGKHVPKIQVVFDQ